MAYNGGNQNGGYRQNSHGRRGHPHGPNYGNHAGYDANFGTPNNGYGGHHNQQFLDNVTFHRGSGSGRQRTNNKELDALSVKVANQMQKHNENPQTSPESVTMSGDLFIGYYSDFVKSKALIAKPFMSTLQPHVAPASVVVPSSTYDLPQDGSVFKTPEGFTREIRHMILRFDPNWFDKGLANAATRNAFQQGNSDIIVIYDEVNKKLGQVITAAKDFYKPFGKIYIICFTESKNNIDGFAALHACWNGHTIIQMNENGPAKLGSFEATNEKLAELFAKRIGQGITNNGYYIRAGLEDMNQMLSPDTAYSFPTQIGRANKSG